MPTTEKKYDGVTEDGFAYEIDRLDPYKARLADGTEVNFFGPRDRLRIALEGNSRLGETVESVIGLRMSIIGQIKIKFWLNDLLAYTHESASVADALRHAEGIVQQLEALPWRWRRADLEEQFQGRKVYYLQQPAEVVTLHAEEGRVEIIADDPKGFNRPPWIGEGDQWTARTVKVDLLDKDIYWFRG